MHRINTVSNRFTALLLSAVMVFAAMSITVFAAADSTQTAVWDGQAAGSFAGGDGTNGNPYQIATAAQLKLFANTVNGGNAGICAVLTENIVLNNGTLTPDADGNPLYNGAPVGEGNMPNAWTPIGLQYGAYYTGTFNGQGHTISGVYINNTGLENCGLFGRINAGASISGVGVINSYIHGSMHVGGICGDSRSTIEYCFFSGSIYGSEMVGGICGYLNGSVRGSYNTGLISGSVKNIGGICGHALKGTVQNCYNTGSVIGGTSYSGGICGYSRATLTNCFNTGTVTGGSDKGGVCGYLSASDSSNLYYLETCGAGGTGTSLNAVQMTGTDAFDNMTGFTSDDWYTTANSGAIRVFPQLKAFQDNPNAQPADTAIHISTAAELIAFGARVNAGESGLCARLTADIVLNEGDLSAYNGVSANTWKQWEPIGDDANQFNGTFDGQGHTVSGLYFNNTSDTEYFSGLFGRIGSDALITGVGMINCYINGYDNVGSICGWNVGGTVSGCYNTGKISAAGESGGGICGKNSGGVIRECFNAGEFNGKTMSGGVCGYNSGGEIKACYNTGSVSGTSHVAGICANTDGASGKITDCYNTGTVNCVNTNQWTGQYLGGVCGNAYAGSVTYCYSTGSIVTTGIGIEICKGGVCGSIGSATVTNCRYLAGTAEGGIDGADTAGSVIPLSAEQLTGGNAVAEMGFPADSWISKDNSTEIISGETEDTVVIKKYSPRFNAFGENAVAFKTEYRIMKTENDSGKTYFLIYTAEQLKTFRNIVNDTLTAHEAAVGYVSSYRANAKLMADIVLNNGTLTADADGNPLYNGEAVSITNMPEEWIPIKNPDLDYGGIFDGQGHTVSGIYINGTGSHVGLFGSTLAGSAVSGVGVVNSYIKGDYDVGGICGLIGGIAENCYNTGAVIGIGSVGGICGSNCGTLNRCFNTGFINGDSNTGGVFGSDNGDAVTECYYLDTCGASSGGTPKTAAQFRSGEVAYLLNGSETDNTDIWFQTVKSDMAPSFDSARGQVYYSRVFGYSNGFQPSYFVTIPAGVTLGGTAEITVSDADTGDGKQINVALTSAGSDGDSFTVVNGRGTVLTYEITQNNRLLAVGDTVLTVNPASGGSGSAVLSFSEPAGARFSGTYTGSITFTVSVDDIPA